MFNELKCKTNFSFLQGASSAQEYMVQAAVLGMKAIAITDINGVYALPRAYEAIRDHCPDLKLISGSQITLQDHTPITLLAKTRKAYGLLCRIISAVHAGKEKGTGFTTFSELIQILENFPGREDLICLPEYNEKTNLALLKEIFPHDMYLTLCRYLDGLDSGRTEFCLNASQKYSLPLIASNEVHYHVPQRRALYDSMTCIREGTDVDKAGFLLFGNEERYLKSELQMRALFSDLPEAVSNTQKISDQCVFSLSELKYTYPKEFIPVGHTARSYLEKLVYQGARVVYRGIIPQAVDLQIRRELNFFAKRNDEHYFLTVYDVVRFANESGIICQGRGSAANSVVCYVLGITSVDPVHMNLLFDRFMNEGRKEPPDIDIDFEHERREEVIQYIYQRFGRGRAAMVAAVRTYRTRSAFLELSKALGVEVGTISSAELKVRFDELAKDKKDRLPLIEDLSTQMKGFPRHLSIHSGGFILSDEPLIEMVPIEPARMQDRTIIQWDKDDLETLGLMKVDILSIGFLTALHKATDLAKISWRDIPSDDKPTYQMICKAKTHGTFQIESRAQMNMLPRTLPQNFYDLVVQVALVRPSPTVGGMVQPFIRGLYASRRGEKFKIGNEKLEAILGRTYGVPIFQEQIMQISIDVAGFTAAEADQLRRSLGLQRSAESVSVLGQKLYAALVSQGIPKEFADNLFSYIKGYAHYGFPESHSASYATLAYKSAYMKCHFPAELVCALINSQPMGFYSIDSLIAEAKRDGVQFLPLHPNSSEWDTTLVAEKTLRMGFRNLRHIREADVMCLIAERQHSEFKSVEDFVFRTTFSKEVLDNLALSDFFQCFGFDRRHSFWSSIQFTNLCDKKSQTQLSLFNGNIQLENTVNLFKPMTLLEQIQTDHQKLRYSLHGNIMRGLRAELPHLPPLRSLAVKRMKKGEGVVYAGVLTVFQRPPPAKGTAFITLEDEQGSVDTVLKKETYEKFQEVITGSRFLIVTGIIQKQGQGTSLLVSQVQSFARNSAAKPIGPQQSLGTLSW